jgi:hypothetical protein
LWCYSPQHVPTPPSGDSNPGPAGKLAPAGRVPGATWSRRSYPSAMKKLLLLAILVALGVVAARKLKVD